MVLWESMGYRIQCLEDGFPDPGLLIREYRLKCGMSQQELADELTISRTMVTRMEKEGIGLESIVTRRKLSKVLGITPALLGLVSLDGLQMKTLYDTSILRRCYELHRENYFTGGSSNLASVNDTVQHISAISKGSGHKSREILEILCQYGYLGIDIAREEQNHKAVDKYTRWTLSLARQLKDPMLLARSLTGASGAMYDSGNYVEAKAYADEALSIKNIPQHLRGVILLDSGRAYARLGLPGSIKYMDDAASIAAHREEDVTGVKLSVSFCHLRKAFALVDMKEYENALNILDLADTQTSTSLIRRKCMIQRLQATILLAQGEYEEATACASTALTMAMAIRSMPNIKPITEMHKQLKGSSYGSSRSVAHLGNSIKALSLL
jgi:transcriptional regulator with XRE-family HTH domain